MVGIKIVMKDYPVFLGKVDWEKLVNFLVESILSGRVDGMAGKETARPWRVFRRYWSG